MTEPFARPSPEPPDISTERQRVLLTIATAVSRSLDPQEVAETALWLAIEAVDLKVGMVLLLEDPQPIILASQGFSLEWLHEFQSAVKNLEGTVIGDILKADEPKVLSDIHPVPGDALVQLFQRVPLQTLAGIPLRAPGDVYGILIIGSPQQQALKIPDVELLEAIASQISAGLRNAWLFSQSWRRLEELESVAEAARAVVSSLDSDEILTRIIEAATYQLDAEEAAFLLLDPVKEELEFVALADPRSAGLKGTRLGVG